MPPAGCLTQNKGSHLALAHSVEKLMNACPRQCSPVSKRSNAMRSNAMCCSAMRCRCSREGRGRISELLPHSPWPLDRMRRRAHSLRVAGGEDREIPAHRYQHRKISFRPPTVSGVDDAAGGRVDVRLAAQVPNGGQRRLLLRRQVKVAVVERHVNLEPRLHADITK